VAFHGTSQLCAQVYSVAQVTLAVDSTGVNPQRLTVQAWTSQCDNRFADGSWHSLDLPYIGQEQDGNNAVRHVYGQSVIITSDRDFEFTYRLKVIYTLLQFFDGSCLGGRKGSKPNGFSLGVMP